MAVKSERKKCSRTGTLLRGGPEEFDFLGGSVEARLVGKEEGQYT